MTKSRDTADILEDVKVDGNVTAVGQETLKDNTGIHNTGVGYRAMFNSSLSGSSNVALGNYTLYANTSGASNTALGYQSLFSNTTASNNNVVGYQALYSNTTGAVQTAMGHAALYSNTTGTENTAFGGAALLNNTTGNYNVAAGRNALANNTTASRNTAVGFQAGMDGTTGQYNTYMGYVAGQNATGGLNTFIGDGTGFNQTSGDSNTYIGQQAGNNMTTGQKNTILGRYTGNQGGLDIRTSSNNIVLSDGDGNPRVWSNGNGLTHLYNSGNTNTLHLFNSQSSGTTKSLIKGYYGVTNINGDSATASFVVYTNGNVQNTNNSYGALSDQKLKENIVDANSQWDDIKDLQVRNYNMIEGQTHTQIGVIAQEVETVSAGLVYESYDQDENGNDLGTVTKSVNYSVLYMKAVKALQEAMARIETLETKVANLEG